jgi:hypothetical protein
MRRIEISDMLYGELHRRMVDARAYHHATIDQITANERRGWAGMPTQNRREQQERLPRAQAEFRKLDEIVTAIEAADTIEAGSSFEETHDRNGHPDGVVY